MRKILATTALCATVLAVTPSTVEAIPANGDLIYHVDITFQYQFPFFCPCPSPPSPTTVTIIGDVFTDGTMGLLTAPNYTGFNLFIDAGSFRNERFASSLSRNSFFPPHQPIIHTLFAFSNVPGTPPATSLTATATELRGYLTATIFDFNRASGETYAWLSIRTYLKIV
jgi:hypothetical protein